MSNGGGSIKKRICNPPAEMVASNGDPEVAGLFIGGGEGSRYLEENSTKGEHEQYGQLKHKFDAKMVTIEQEYVEARKELARTTAEKVHAAFDWLLEKTGYEGPSGY